MKARTRADPASLSGAGVSWSTKRARGRARPDQSQGTGLGADSPEPDALHQRAAKRERSSSNWATVSS